MSSAIERNSKAVCRACSCTSAAECTYSKQSCSMSSITACNHILLQRPKGRPGPTSPSLTFQASVFRGKIIHSFKGDSRTSRIGTTRCLSRSSVITSAAAANVLTSGDDLWPQEPRERVTPPKLPPTPASSKLLDVLPYLVKLAVSDR